jgi:hypothetical protein
VPAGKCTYNGGVLQTSDMQQPCNFHFLLTVDVHLLFLWDLGCASLRGGESAERGEIVIIVVLPDGAGMKG